MPAPSPTIAMPAPPPPDDLARYREKRDFGRTPEPAGKAPASRSVLSFVVQKHAARRLHYDFRLELEGTLKSWAVPKGPSLDPGEKRMAVQVEDHPLEYGSFEGTIPAGQYGAGEVIVWDKGWWEPLGDPAVQHRAGKLKFRLHGQKLRGAWTLVRTRGGRDAKQEHWLLIKERDGEARPEAEYRVVDALPGSVKAAPLTATLPAAARPASLPPTLAPQLASLIETPPRGGDWSYEIKFDGYRLLARIESGAARLFTRNGNDWTSKLAPLAAAVRALDLASGWLDGEIVVLDAGGRPDFGALQAALADDRLERVVYFLFDLPYYAGFDLRPAPLAERRALLADLVAHSPSPGLRFSEDFAFPPHQILQHACRLGLEGVVGKRRDAPYASGRSSRWIKLKCKRRQEFVVGGYTEPQGGRQGFGALLLGVYDDDGRLVYAGRVGTGFDDRTLLALTAKLRDLHSDRCPFHQPPPEAKGRWVEPDLVAEVSFTEWTREGILRQPVFHGLRDDKPPTSIRREMPRTPPAVEAPAGDPVPSSAAPLRGVRITHPERVIDPSTGYTKRDLFEYYSLAADYLLPYLDRRPVAVLRAPNGIGAEMFFQKHGDEVIAGARRMDEVRMPGHPPPMEIATRKALLAAVQMNVIEFHTWNATTAAIEKPDRMTFDLDPGEGLPWRHMLEAAQLVRTVLEELSLRSFVKTSGGNGLHVVVPLTPHDDWATVKAFSKAVTEHLAAVIPQRFVAKSGPRNRVGRIFIDYLRNGRGATTAEAYAARARPGMGVSLPCAWDELLDLRAGDQWNIATARPRLPTSAQAWREYRLVDQGLGPAARRLLEPTPRQRQH